MSITSTCSKVVLLWLLAAIYSQELSGKPQFKSLGGIIELLAGAGMAGDVYRVFTASLRLMKPVQGDDPHADTPTQHLVDTVFASMCAKPHHMVKEAISLTSALRQSGVYVSTQAYTSVLHALLRSDDK